MTSPRVDYNNDITSYRFAQTGRHAIVRKGRDPGEESVGLESNTLFIEV